MNKEKKESEPKTIKYTKWFLLVLGVWPFVNENSTNNELRIGIVLQIISQSLFAFTLIPAGYHILMREKDMNARIVLFGPISFFTTNMLKYCAIIYHRNDIKKCIKYIKYDWNQTEDIKDRKVMMESALTTRNFTLFLAGFVHGGGIFYHTFLPFLVNSQITDDKNITHRPLVYPGYDIIIDPYVSPIYEIIFSLHCLTAIVVHNIFIVSVNIAASFVTHACSQVKIIISKIECLIDDVDEDSASLQKRVAGIMSAHARVLRFTLDIAAILRELCFFEIIASTLVICLLEFYILTTWSDSDTASILVYGVVLITMSSNIFIFCYIGELLQQQVMLLLTCKWNEAGLSIYLIDWYRLPPKIRVTLVLFLATSQIPRKITAGGYIDLTLSSFADVIRTSFAYLNLLRTMQN